MEQMDRPYRTSEQIPLVRSRDLLLYPTIGSDVYYSSGHLWFDWLSHYWRQCTMPSPSSVLLSLIHLVISTPIPQLSSLAKYQFIISCVVLVDFVVQVYLLPHFRSSHCYFPDLRNSSLPPVDGVFGFRVSNSISNFLREEAIEYFRNLKNPNRVRFTPFDDVHELATATLLLWLNNRKPATMQDALRHWAIFTSKQYLHVNTPSPLAPPIIITEIEDPLSELDFSFLNDLPISSASSLGQPSSASVKVAIEQLRHFFALDLLDLFEEQHGHSSIKDFITISDKYQQVVAKVNIIPHQVSEFKKCREDLLWQVDALKVEIALLEGEAATVTTSEKRLSREYITEVDFVEVDFVKIEVR
ncbi:hypothetical protein JCGZ_19743 [Jatropha curcas]|uniref:Uncharacterized protein n=1 Tax=Jatropha curcas TaxID=180498 RepID=A0A067L809_JATCU|nr:hypothetical protein JCGZ_19743 [Jatropha curcas]